MEEEEHKIIPYRFYGRILVMLMLLTAMTISVTLIQLSTWSIMVALIIAAVKGGLVMMYFMHLRYERPIFRVFAFGAIALLAIVIIITFLDYLYR